MENKYFENVKIKLKERPNKILSLNQWLFITINPAKSVVDNSDKTQFEYLKNFMLCKTTSEIQHLFDTIQDKFGDSRFSQRNNPNYLYLCSLVANFPKTLLTDDEQETINTFLGINQYLIYEL
ncbi:hypothetical protein EFN46_06095 [Leuconostoc pseudomesenteroides]|nr:hypothetical protein [Leuconostoc pseudomesenteroides]